MSYLENTKSKINSNQFHANVGNEFFLNKNQIWAAMKIDEDAPQIRPRNIATAKLCSGSAPK